MIANQQITRFFQLYYANQKGLRTIKKESNICWNCYIFFLLHDPYKLKQRQSLKHISNIHLLCLHLFQPKIFQAKIQNSSFKFHYFSFQSAWSLFSLFPLTISLSLFPLLFSLFLVLFISFTVLFGTIYRSHCTISINFYFYLQYFQQKMFSFSKIRRSQIDSQSLRIKLEYQEWIEFLFFNVVLHMTPFLKINFYFLKLTFS